jgi:glutathione S-transferase
MLELYQAEWCPFSHLVRERLTELGLPFVARQVPADRAERDELERVAGTRSIPVLITEEGEALSGDAREIVAWLSARYPEAPDAAQHAAHNAAEGPYSQG